MSDEQVQKAKNDAVRLIGFLTGLGAGFGGTVGVTGGGK